MKTSGSSTKPRVPSLSGLRSSGGPHWNSGQEAGLTSPPLLAAVRERGVARVIADLRPQVLVLQRSFARQLEPVVRPRYALVHTIPTGPPDLHVLAFRLHAPPPKRASP